jgi:TonB family protein
MNCSSCGNPVEVSSRFCSRCGAPVQLQTTTPMPGATFGSPQPPLVTGPPIQPPKTSSGCGKIILVVGLVVVLLAAGIAAAIYFGYRYTQNRLKSSEPYQASLSALRQNAKVREKFGDIKDTGFPLGTYSQNADGSGKAAFVMSVQGTKTTGYYEVSLVRSSSVWRVDSGSVRTANGETIDVRDVEEAAQPPEVDQEDVNAKDAVKVGVLNSRAISLPQPAYPPIAKTAKVSGKVTVQVLVDEQGRVIAARAISGHPLLQSAAVTAARQAKFRPRNVNGKPVKVSGTIVYDLRP